MYQALYRKYRPRVFDDVVGQEHITTTLKNEIIHGKIAHAYIFTGSRGTGKTTCAKILAKAVNCQNPQNGNPCGVCEICRGIDNGSILDVTEIDAASNNGVDYIRDLREEANFTPGHAKYRVYIIDEMHMLSQGAFNALLKILEEPPAHVIFILATTEIHKVAATIMSRCQRFDYRRIETSVIAKRLLDIAVQEQIALDEQAAFLIGQLADGGMRDALSLLDLCISHSGENSGEITVQVVRECSGVVGNHEIVDLIQAVIQKDMQKALEVVSEIHTQSVDMQRFCVGLMEEFRNIMICKLTQNPMQLLSCMPDELEELQQLSVHFTPTQLFRIISLLTTAATKIGQTVYKKAEVEMTVIRLIDENLDASIQSLNQRVTQLEAVLHSSTVRVASKPQTEVKTEEQDSVSPILDKSSENDVKSIKPRGTQTGAPDLSNSVRFEQWPEVLESLSTVNPPLSAALQGSNLYLAGNYALIETENSFFLELIRKNDSAKQSLRQALQNYTGKLYNLGPYRKGKQQASAEQSALNQFVKKAEELNITVNKID